MTINNSCQLISVRSVFTHRQPPTVTFSMCFYFIFSTMASARWTQQAIPRFQPNASESFVELHFLQSGLALMLVFLPRLFATRKANSQRFLRLPTSNARRLLPPTHPPTH